MEETRQNGEDIKLETGLTAIDLFCGIGGFRIGLDKLGIKTVFSSDIDKFAQDTYEANFGELPSGDITKIAASDIPHFDILTAGFPCQPFSYSGRNEGFEDKTRGTLFFDICRIIEYHKPQMFLLENVKGLKSHNKGNTMNIILNTLKDLGYNVRWNIINSLTFGLPQARERWYCVGFKNHNFDFSFPNSNKTEGNPKLKSIICLENNEDRKLQLSQLELDRISFHFKTD